MTKNRAQGTLTIVWAIFAGLIILLGLTWASTNYFGNETKEILTWVAQSCLPYMLLIFTFHFSSRKINNNGEVDILKVSLAIGASILYAIFILGICLSFARTQFAMQNNPMKIVDNLSNYLIFFQSSLALIFGLFFSTINRTSNRQSS